MVENKIRIILIYLFLLKIKQNQSYRYLFMTIKRILTLENTKNLKVNILL